MRVAGDRHEAFADELVALEVRMQVVAQVVRIRVPEEREAVEQEEPLVAATARHGGDDLARRCQGDSAIPIAALALPFVAGALARTGRTGWAFTATALSIALITATLFLNLYPRVLVSSTSNAYSLTIWGTSSSHYTLVVMSIVALILTPVVLVYQAWTYWVFRARLGGEDVGTPLEALARSPLGSG